MARVWYGAVAMLSMAVVASIAVVMLPLGAPFGVDVTDVKTVMPRFTVSADGVPIPRGFEAFAKSLSTQLSMRQDHLPPEGSESVDCPEVTEPSVPTEVPSWAAGGADELRQQGVEEVIDRTSRKRVKAFIRGSDVVIKRCTSSALHAVVQRTEASWDKKHPEWDIYFDCHSHRKFIIRTGKTIQFGKGSKSFTGTWRLMAPHFNVVLDGEEKQRIMQIAALAHVTLYGLTLRGGHEVMELPTEASKIPYGGWNGGAVLVLAQGALTAYKTRFFNNRALSYYARWGGGGAIKAETKSYLMLWGCDLSSNQASVGGAVASSSAHVVFIRDTRFNENTAFGGVDNSDGKKGREKPNLLVRGGAIRVDQVTGHASSKEHVVLCNSHFTRNRITFHMKTLKAKYGFSEEHLTYVRAAGAAVTLWNSPQNLELESGNQHFASVQSCVFEENEERVGPTGLRLGRYVLETEGAGNCKLHDSVFRNNKVARAVARIDNSSRFNDGMQYQTALENLEFHDNGDVFNLEFEAQAHASTCTFRGVEGIDDQTGDCRQIALDAVADRGNINVDEEKY